MAAVVDQEPTVQTTVMMREAINLALAEAMAKDERVVLLGEDIADPAGGVLKVTDGLSSRFGHHRVRDTPISESAIIGAATGAAMAGLRPVAEIMIGDFLGVCLDQLVNHAAKLHYMTGGAVSVPLTVRTAVCGRSQFGATHSQSLEAWLMHCPGLKVGMPSTPFDAKGMLTTCIFDDDPCVLMENVTLYQKSGSVGVGEYAIPMGLADVKRAGSDVSFITYGTLVDDCLAAADTLHQQGISAEVVDLRWLVPLDREAILASVAKTKRAVVVHSATRFCGPGAEIAALIAEELSGELAAPVQRVGAPYVPIPTAAPLEQAYYPDLDKIVGGALRTLG
jgi:pyruvate dehydrogenase E1 component beta subunit